MVAETPDQTAVEVVNLEKQDFEDAKVWTKM